MFSSLERIICTTLLLLTTLVGYISCIYIIVYAIFYSKRRTGFYKICVFKCIVNFIVLSVFLFWVCPHLILAEKSDVDGPIGVINIVCFLLYTKIYEALLYVAMILSVNRFVAIMFWSYYDKIFNTKIIYILLLLITVYSVYSGYLSSDIKIFYDGEKMMWDTPEPMTTDIVLGVFLFIGLASILNLVTMVYVLVTTVLLSKSSSSSKRVKDNATLFLQAFFQDLVFVVDITFMFILSSLWSNNIFQFICANYTSALVHAIDGPIMLAFQRHMLHPIRKLFGRSSESVATSWANPRSAISSRQH